MRIVRQAQQGVEHCLSVFRRGGRGKAWPCPFARIGSQSELRYQQQPTLDVLKRLIHASRGIRKNPVGQQTLKHAFGIVVSIPALDSDQREHAGADGGDPFALDRDGSPRDALDQCNHDRMAQFCTTPAAGSSSVARDFPVCRTRRSSEYTRPGLISVSANTPLPWRRRTWSLRCSTMKRSPSSQTKLEMDSGVARDMAVVAASAANAAIESSSGMRKFIVPPFIGSIRWCR